MTSYLCSFFNNKHSTIPEDWAAAAKTALATNPEFNAYAEKMFAEFKDYLDSRPPAAIWNKDFLTLFLFFYYQKIKEKLFVL